MLITATQHLDDETIEKLEKLKIYKEDSQLDMFDNTMFDKLVSNINKTEGCEIANSMFVRNLEEGVVWNSQDNEAERMIELETLIIPVGTRAPFVIFLVSNTETSKEKQIFVTQYSTNDKIHDITENVVKYFKSMHQSKSQCKIHVRTVFITTLPNTFLHQLFCVLKISKALSSGMTNKEYFLRKKDRNCQ